jgi:uncharacterized protein (DUF488 family)
VRIYTLGYQGLSSTIYVQGLINAGVGLVVDVREHAWSQRPAFVKANLRNTLAAAGIDYCHVKEAGNPSKNRKSAKTATECLTRYRSYLRGNTRCLDQLLSIIQEATEMGRPACLTCYERDSQECHRSVLLEELTMLAPTLLSIHLQPTLPTKVKSQRHEPSLNSLASTAFLAPTLLPLT